MVGVGLALLGSLRLRPAADVGLVTAVASAPEMLFSALCSGWHFAALGAERQPSSSGALSLSRRGVNGLRMPSSDRQGGGFGEGGAWGSVAAVRASAGEKRHIQPLSICQNPASEEPRGIITVGFSKGTYYMLGS